MELKPWQTLMLSRWRLFTEWLNHRPEDFFQTVNQEKTKSFLLAGVWSLLDSPERIALKDRFHRLALTMPVNATAWPHVIDVMELMTSPDHRYVGDLMRQAAIKRPEPRRVRWVEINPRTSGWYGAFNQAVSIRLDCIPSSLAALYSYGQAMNFLAHYYERAGAMSWRSGCLYDRKTQALTRILKEFPNEAILRYGTNGMFEILTKGRTMHIPVHDAPPEVVEQHFLQSDRPHV